MTFADWTYVGVWAADTTYKHEGNAALLLKANATAQRKNFSATQLQIVFWALCPAGNETPTVNLSSYGDLGFTPPSGWNKIRYTFWYDSTSDLRLGRKEKWDSSTNSWVKQGDDVVFGTGAPSAGTLTLKSNGDIRWDDIYVYTT